MFARIEGLVCWKCGVSLEQLSLPLRRLEECRGCCAELHVCRLCEFYDTAVAKSCREPVAEEVKDKTRANFCDYFRPKAGAHVPAPGAAADARSQLDALFGGTVGGGIQPAAAEDEARSRLEELFGGGSPKKSGG